MSSFIVTFLGPNRWQVQQTGVLKTELAAGVNGKQIILDGGNVSGADITIGTNDAFDLIIKAGGSVIATFKDEGDVVFSGFIERSITTGITASTTQTQGQQALTKEVNQVATVANDGDVVTAPAWAAGRKFEVINGGANRLTLYPASGDDLGAGTDVGGSVLPGEAVEFVGTTTDRWERDADTSTFFGDMYEEENTDAFTISAADEHHCYHDSGIVQGTESGWAFDAGGAGTSFPIASIANGADSGVDIAVTTTGNHLLAAGDIISQTNLSDSAYVGVFVVKAIISDTIYEVAAVFTATGTGTMNQAATLKCGAEAGGLYQMRFWASGTSASNNQTIEFGLFKNATRVVGTHARRTFGTGADTASIAGGSPPTTVVADDKISLIVNNLTSAGNMTIRNLTLFLERL